MSLESLVVGAIPTPVKKQKRKWAPYIDRFDLLFLVVLSAIVITVPFSLLEQPTAFLMVAAGTAFIALYRLRHRLQKKRATVREGFEERDGQKSPDFGLRNFGPGPALYLQAVVTVENGTEDDTVVRVTPHDRPVHLEEGEFVSLVHGMKGDWLGDMLEKYGSNRVPFDDGDQPEVNLYYSHVSRFGSREPVEVSTERDDENILSELKRTDDARSIELQKLKEVMGTPQEIETL